MKRDITCVQCSKSWRTMVGKYPDEDVKLVRGLIKKHNLRCDSCNMELPLGSSAFAISVSTPRTPYSPWEHDYIDIHKEG